MNLPAKKSFRRARRTNKSGANGNGYAGQPASNIITTRGFTSRSTTVAPFPFRYDARLTYGVNVTISTSGSSPLAAKYRFSLNSGYDPDRTATGSQPYQWDQLIALYQYYLVKAAYVDLSFTDPTVDGLWVGWSVHPSMNTNDDPAGKDLGQLMERPNYTCKGLNNTGAQIVNCRARVPLHEVIGLSRSQYMNQTDIYGAFFNTNPTQEIYLDLFVCDPTATVSSHSVRAVGKIIYDIQFWGYAAPNSS